MMRKSFFTLLALMLVVGAASATLQPIAKTGQLILTPLSFDTFNDTIRYDDGTIQWWYGGLTNFTLATKFTPLTTFHLQRMIIAMNGTSTTPVNLFLKNDSSGFPGGAPIWSGSLVYTTSNTWLGVTIDTTNLPQYSFAASSNFWLTVQSNGPPYEIYDAAPVQPPRSKSNATGLGGWVNSPGDNFIRAIGMYSGGIVDVGCDSVWHGQNFHLPNPGSLTIGCKVKNYGTSAATFQVACSLFTEGAGPSYTFYSALTPQTVTSLGAGATTNVTFPATSINVNNRYRIRTRTLLVGDTFPDNDSKDTETQIYTAPAELRYDDDLYYGAAYSSTAGAGWAMKYNPHQSGNYNITQVRVMADFTTGDLAARVQVLDDNGVGGAPSTILWQTTQVMVAGWNTFNINLVNQTASFYIAYIFEHGDSTSALRMDSYPSSGMGWTKSSGTTAWTADPSADDWMMRATVATGGAYNITVTLIPYGTPIVIPSGGGSFDFNIATTNNEATPQTYQAWGMLTLPNGNPYGPVLGPVSVTIPASGSINRDRTQNIPSYAPSGAYSYNAYVGTYPGTIYDLDSFPFTKSQTGDGGAWVGDWANTGESFDASVNVVPAVFALLGNYPNPFNPTTSIEFSLPEAGWIQLAVYDVSGNLVRTLVNGHRDAGVQKVAFEAAGLPSGIYLYKLTSADHTAIGKMVLMK